MNEHLQIAHPITRFASYFFDILLCILLFLIYVLILSKVVTLSVLLDSFLMGLILLLFIPNLLVFLNSFLISKLGGTIGKLVFGLEIVREENSQRLSFWRAFFRNNIGYTASGALFGLGFIWILVDEKRRGWHDLVSDTVVVVKHKSFWILGTILTAVLIASNILLLTSIYKNFSENQNLYYSLFEDISKEFQSTR